MTTLSTPLVLPPRLPVEHAPTVAAHISSIDPWIIYHLKSTILSHVHYEHQLYGPLGAFLTSVFPLRRRYMTIGQGLVRRAMDAREVDEDLGNISFGSTGALHESRTLPGAEVGKMYPDFLIVKVTPQPVGLPRDHYIVSVIEVKRDEDQYSTAVTQMTSYMRQIADHPSRDAEMRGFLISESEITEFTLDPENDHVSRRFDMFGAGDPFTRAITRIAVRHWNYSND